MLLIAARGLLAQNETEDHLLQHGIELRRIGDDEAALREFKKAYATTHSPRAGAQVGLAEQAVGLWSDAEEHLTQALRDGANDPWIQKNHAVLTGSLFTIKKHVARIEVSGPPPGARVSISGRDVGLTPLRDPVKVNEGPVSVKIALEGWRAAHRELTVSGGQFVRLSVELEPDVPSARTPGPPAAPRLTALGAPRPAGVDLTRDALEPSQAAPAGGHHVWLWIGLGAIVIGGAVTAILLATRKTTYPSADGSF